VATHERSSKSPTQTATPSASATTSSDLISRRFAALRERGGKALVIYITAGHPDRAQSLALLRGIANAGADVIELGVPFSDPLADGPVIQASSQRALEQGMTFDGVLELAAEARVDVPLVLFSYLNPIVAAGPKALARAAASGINGMLVTDLPVGGDPDVEREIGESALAFVRLVAPTTPTPRMAEIAKHGSGFVYLISRLGVTGMRNEIASGLAETIDRLRSATKLPVCVGFGISTPAQAREVAKLADGVVVGSAVVRAAETSVDAAVSLVREMRKAIDGR
jgi:tryptophan synthase alpha chain